MQLVSCWITAIISYPLYNEQIAFIIQLIPLKFQCSKLFLEFLTFSRFICKVHSELTRKNFLEAQTCRMKNYIHQSYRASKRGKVLRHYYYQKFTKLLAYFVISIFGFESELHFKKSSSTMVKVSIRNISNLQVT